jgi:Arc/MetJ family transcription regulator
MVKRTNIDLDMDLAEEAAQEIGTQRTTDTAHQAVRKVVARARLAQRDFEDLSPEALEALRQPAGRTA